MHSQGGHRGHAGTWLAAAASILLASVTASGALAAAAITASASPVAADPAYASAGQCRNGGGSPPAPLPCLTGAMGGMSYSQWVSGTANRSNSHWSEGDIIPYRVAYTGLGAGTYRLRLYYRTVADGYHAIDYLGSFDTTETTGPTPTPVHRNNNNPCFDVLTAAAGSGCTAPGTPPVPASTIPIPPANLTGQMNACGARSLPTAPAQVPGVFSLFAPSAAGASLTDASYVTQNVQTAGGTCTTTMDVTIHIANAPPSGTQWSAVLAFGGRIASELDWGDGNAASSISGAGATAGLNNLNGNNGAVGGTMGFMANAIAPRPAVATSVSSPTVPAGSTLTDLATVTGVSPYGTPTGHVQFRLCSNTTTGCPQGTGVDIGSPVPLSAVSGLSAQARSEPFGAGLAPGNYCLGAAFENDSNSFYSSIYFGNSPATECFRVTPASPSISTHLNGTLLIVGGSVTDTATLHGPKLPLLGPTTVDYRVYPSVAACQADATAFTASGTPPAGGTSAGTVTVDPATGAVPPASHTFTSEGTFYWAAFFPGDANNDRAVSDCDLEPVRVTLVGEPEISTHLSDTAITVGGLVTDTATLHDPVLPLAPGVTVNYRIYDSVAACQADATPFTDNGTPPAGGTDVATVTVDPNTGVVESFSHTFTSAGTFYWAAFFPGDAHNARAVSDCDLEPVLVSPATPEISTHLGDTAITVGGSVTDTATLHGPHLPLAGTATVDYRAYPSVAACQADATAFTASGTPPAGGTSAGTVTVTGTGVVPSASHTFPGTGTFYWAAFFSGDASNDRAVSDCDLEPVQVAAVLPAISTHLGDTEVTVGVPVTDTATLHSPHLPLAGTATVNYRAYDSVAACQADATVFTGSGTPPAGGTSAATVTVDPVTGAVPPASHTFTPAGTFYWAAFFSGDANNQRAVSGCDLEPVQVARAAPAISTHLGDTAIIVGRKVTDIGTLHDAHLPLAGTATVNFRIYDSVAACQADATPFTDSGTPPAGGIDVGTIAVNPSVGTSSTSHALSSAGTFYWVAFFSGDASNDRAVSDCDLEPIQVARVAPAISTHLGSTALTVGGSVTDTATLLKAHLPLVGAATVDYRVYDSVAACQADATAFADSGTPPAGGTSVATVTANPATGTISPASHALTSAGTFYWAAFFSGDANNVRTASDCDLEPVRVAAATPAISTHLNHPAITVGGSVTDTATLHDAHLPLQGTATTVNYRVYSSPAACQADATPFIDSGTAPAHGTSVATVTVSPATGAVPSAGHALTHAGTVYWAAFFSGDANNDRAVSDCGAEPVLVAAATPAISTHLNHAAIIAGESVTDTATLHGPRLPLAGAATVNYRAYDSVAACEADATAFSDSGTRPAHGTSVATVTVSPATGAVPSAGHALTHAGTVYWAAFFSGDANNHRAVSDCAREPVQISAAHPGMTVVKTARVTSFTGAGQVITYSYRVTNTGNVPLHGVTVTDDRIRGVSCPATTLAAGASMTCTAHYTTTMEDVDRGHIANAATVTGTTPGGVRVRARSTLMLPRRKLVPVTG